MKFYKGICTPQDYDNNVMWLRETSLRILFNPTFNKQHGKFNIPFIIFYENKLRRSNSMSLYLNFSTG